MALLESISLFFRSFSNPSLLKGGAGSGNGGHRGRQGEVGGSAPSVIPKSSADIKTLAEASAYFKHHFGDGKPIPIKVHSSGKIFNITVAFVGDHAYTEDGKGRRIFEPNRSQYMDEIWSVLQAPDHIRQSEQRHNRKAYDKCLEFKTRYGRVVLEPVPTPEELASGECSHFNFITWHFVGNNQYLEAKRSKATNPTKLAKAELYNNPALAPFTVTARHLIDRPLGLIAGFSRLPGQRGSSRDAYPLPEGFFKTSTGVLEHKISVADPVLFFKATPAGARWITVHPNGKDAKGTPVMVQETKHGSGTYHVIGGAGGKLNYLKLRGVKSEAHYKQESVERSKARRESVKAQKKQDKAAGTFKKKVASKRDVHEQKLSHESAFVQTVSQAMGWKPEETAFPEHLYENVSEPARKKAGQTRWREYCKCSSSPTGLSLMSRNTIPAILYACRRRIMIPLLWCNTPY